MPNLANSITALREEFGLTPVLAAEIECYVVLADESSASMDAFWVPVHQQFKAEGLPILCIEKERGLHQYEVITQIMAAERLAPVLTTIRRIIEAQAAQMGVSVHFSAKPFPDQPSSGLHVHLHLADEEGLNAFHKTEEWTGDYLRWSLGGLLASLEGDLPVFFPDEADYLRLKDADHVPKIHGWGVNNRYCALRIPADPDPYSKRIEHRVPCANAEPEAVVAAILAAVLRGLREEIEPPEQEYGKFGVFLAAFAGGSE